MTVITGTASAETLVGTDGTDTITGGLGNDVLRGRAGNDLFIWNPGDGNDTVAGGADFDTLRFTGAVGGENITLSAAGGHASLTRNVDSVALDLDDVERIQINALAGMDTITINTLAGTDVDLVAINLAVGGAGDGSQDFVEVNAGGASNAITLTKAGGVVTVAGLAATITVAGAESADAVRVNGQSGNDTINAGALAFGTLLLTLDGGAGNDKLTGSKGEDTIWAGTGNDTITGGGAYDAVSLGAGNDLFLWAAGHGGDLVQGDSGFDTMRFSGNSANEVFTIYASGAYAHLNRNMAEDTSIYTIERLEVNALGGADNIIVSDLTATDVTQVAIDLGADGEVDTVTLAGSALADFLSVSSLNGKVVTDSLGATVTVSTAEKTDKVIIDGGDENDIINAGGLAAGIVALQIQGGLGADTMLGSAGNDIVRGGAGNDLAFLGAGNDRFVWNPGDGNDTIDGQGGTDTLQVNAANVNEFLTLAAVGQQAQFSRDVAAVALVANDIERIQVNALAGADTIFVNDLTGTDVKLVEVNAGVDGQADTLLRTATNGNDVITVAKAGSVVTVTGLSAQLNVVGDSTDVLWVDGADGNDKIDGSQLTAGALTLALAGGLGNDTITGSKGNDYAFLNDGNDLFLWNPGQGSDTIAGGADSDTVRMTGSAADETFGIAANGAGVALTRSVGAVLLDIDTVERLQVRALGGADYIGIGDLTGTDATRVDVDLAAVAGGAAADGKVDTVATAGTAAGEVITVSNSGGTIVVAGLQAKVYVTHADQTDRLILNGGDGGDIVDARLLAAGRIALQLVGGVGSDTLYGSAGNDTVIGGVGADLGLLGAGNDLFVWNPGDGNDIIEGEAGTDTLRFSGSAANDGFLISPSSGRVLLDLNGSSVLMNLDNVERIQLNALDGSDTIFVDDVSSTDLQRVAIDLGSSDGDADTVYVVGAAANETVNVAMSGSAVKVTGLPAEISVAHAESANDLLRLYAAGGDDTINASTLPAAATRLWLAGGDGKDTITGGAGNDRLDGDQDNDVLNGGSGRDTLFGGTGNDAIEVSLGNDIVRYTSVLDGRDVVSGFDGNATGGQDVLDLDILFDSLMVGAASRAGRVSITDNGASVAVRVDTNGDATFDLAVATLKTADSITVGQDVLVGA